MLSIDSSPRQGSFRQVASGVRCLALYVTQVDLVVLKNVLLLPGLALVTQLFRQSVGAFGKTFLSKTSSC
eukprot:3656314-Amphidinium_carterae.1